MTALQRMRDYFAPREIVDTSPKVSDEVKCTTCYMCACRCGIKVHLKDGGIRYIEGNRDHPINRGVICGKGASGIMQQVSPAKLRKPLRRVGERGSGEFREVEWDEWFEKFDESNLALIVEDRTANQQQSNFNKLVKREGSAKPKTRAAG